MIYFKISLPYRSTIVGCRNCVYSFLLCIEITKEKTNNILTILIQVFKLLMLWKVCFKVYYLNGDGYYISQEEIFDMLKNSLYQQSSEDETGEGIKELVEITLKKMVRMKTSSLYPIKWMLDKVNEEAIIYFPPQWM